MGRKSVIIIGAGPAGLTAAYELIKIGGYQPIIIEKDAQVGGISKTVEYHGNKIDIGGHRFFSKNKLVNDIWQELMPLQAYPALDDKQLKVEKQFPAQGTDPEKEDCVMLLRNRTSRIFAFGKFFNYPITFDFETFSHLGLYRTFNASVGYLCSLFNNHPINSLEDFYVKRFGKALYRMFFEKYTEKVWGVHPSILSPAWGPQRVKELSLLKLVSEFVYSLFNKDFKSNIDSLIDQFKYPKYGPGQLWEIMADYIIKNGGELHLNTLIKDLEFSESGAFVTLQCGDTIKRIETTCVFSSMPISELISFLPAPSEVTQIAKGLPYRDFITVEVLLKKMKIRNLTNKPTIADIPPDNWIYIQDESVKMGRLQIFNNWSPYLLKDINSTVWLGLEYFATIGDELWSKTESEMKEFAISELVKIGFIDASDVLDSSVIKIEKAYPSYCGSYSNFDKVKDYLNSIKNLYCIGRNGQHRYNNMDHSMLTGIEAARLLKRGDSDKSSLWNVSTAGEYQEVDDSNS